LEDLPILKEASKKYTLAWFVLPNELLALRHPKMEESWIQRENILCRSLVFYSCLILGLALPCFFLLDSLRQQFDPIFSSVHRIGGMFFFLSLAALIRWDAFKNMRFGFAFYKSLFMLSALYVAAFQVQLIFLNSAVPRIYQQAILVGTVGILNMGLRSSLAFAAIHTLILVIISLFHLDQWMTDSLVVTDLSYQATAIILVYILSSRYSLSVQLHISNFIREEAATNRADHAYNQLTKLVLPHVVTQINQGYHIEDTMPVGRDHAYVLCFDIVGSSQVDHEDFYQSLESFQARCFEAMNENYNPKSLEGEAFRIKEMGDGFLCSVGFPLKTPHHENAAALAHRLALRFLEIFDQDVAGLGYHRPIVGAVGIAYGPIEGYFPSTGPKQYDLRDRSLILATRYQELRKIILVQETLSHHALIISKTVYQRLPDAAQRLYQKVLLGDVRVRDDHSADAAYVALIKPCQACVTRTVA
jgi:class 3 adenylate cyclase